MINPVRARRGPRAALAALLGAGLLSAGVTSTAAADCPHTTSSPAFARFGDLASYSLAPRGSFESGARGWSLSGARVTDGNESYNLVPGYHSLAIAGFGNAVSPWICRSSGSPSFRLCVRRGRTDEDDALTVSLRWVNLLGITVNTPVASLDPTSAWTPTPVLQLGSSVPLWLPGSSLNVALVFSSGGEGTWAIDDVYIDPYSR